VSRPPGLPRTARWVLVAAGGGDLRTYPLPAGVELILGRDLDCDVVLDHHRVSRRHARLSVAGAGDTLAIEDLGSRNGTRVGEALEPNQPWPVRAGDAIWIGPFTLTAVRGALQHPPSLVVEDPQALVPPQPLVTIARGGANVLIRGEPGTAKRPLAEALHRLSGRGGRFVALDCTEIGPELLEGELFGDERGGPRVGALEEAGEGTVLLEGISELPPPLQTRLLHAIERREAARVGGGEPFAVRARLVCGTHRDLLASIEAGAFRLDLYYRIAGASLTIRIPRAELGPEEEAERRRILDALDQCSGNQARAAKLLGITRAELAAKLLSYRITLPPRPRK
jgi:two-component system nitrogen regulation response regulator GlnG